MDSTGVENPNKEGTEEKKKSSILRDKNFLLLWAGQGVSQAGDWIYLLALVSLVIAETGSAAVTGTVLMMMVIPQVFLGPIAGSYADRWSRKNLIVWMDAVRGIVVLYLGWLVISDTLTLPVLYVGTVIMSIAQVFFNPALRASIPTIVPEEELNRANSLIGITSKISGVIGPAIGGILVVTLGVPLAFIINGISFLFSAFSESFITIPLVRREGPEKHVLADMKEGFGFILEKKPILGIIIVLGAMTFFAAPLVIVFKILSETYYHMGDLAYGLLISADSLGILVSTFILAVKPKIENKSRILILFPIVAGVTLLGIGTVINFYFAMALMAIQGIISGFGEIVIITLLQTLTPNEKRGKVFGVYVTMTMALVPLSYAVMGTLIDLTSVVTMLLISGTALIIGGISISLVPGIREL
ncbi:MAG: MFS transporter [Theionarchaea archaeon]|nr:MFS transporter [Theionarchaea archaeon]MBU7001933.1 MFS transporter [Theionarchaea archaeon]MBU7020420.1 MFS transporter [Theionarchaea archaeon]MBU7041637.1 MFS transporter [Theionarchaea archaeon]